MNRGNNMRKASFILAIGILLLSLSSNSSASLHRFSSKWINSNPNTRGVTALDIDVSGSRVTVQAWGKCHPRDCDWGRVEGDAYAPDASSNLVESAQLISAVFRSGLGKRLLIIRRGDRNQLNVEVLAQFGDRSGRPNYFTTETFSREIRRPRPMDIKEDCVSFNPVTLEARLVNGSWKIVDGSHWLFDFGNNEEDARQAIAIIKKHGFTNSCFVGRPDPGIKYLRK